MKNKVLKVSKRKFDKMKTKQEKKIRKTKYKIKIIRFRLRSVS